MNNFSEPLFQLINDSVIDLDINDIRAVYEALSTSDGPTPSLTFDVEKLKMPAPISQQTLEDIIQNGSLFGIDLPFWFSDTTAIQARIMIIGIDPLRNRKTFDAYGANNAYDKKLVVGTPYAAHDRQMREHKTKVYWNFIQALKRKHFVYLTDIFKCYFQHHTEGRSYLYFQNNKLVKPFEQLLLAEIGLIKPTHIVTFGNFTHLMVSSLKQSAQKTSDTFVLIRLPHPAARSSAWIPYLQGVNASISNKVEYMKNEVSKFIDL